MSVVSVVLSGVAGAATRGLSDSIFSDAPTVSSMRRRVSGAAAVGQRRPGRKSREIVLLGGGYYCELTEFSRGSKNFFGFSNELTEFSRRIFPT